MDFALKNWIYFDNFASLIGGQIVTFHRLLYIFLEYQRFNRQVTVIAAGRRRTRRKLSVWILIGIWFG